MPRQDNATPVISTAAGIQPEDSLRQAANRAHRMIPLLQRGYARKARPHVSATAHNAGAA